MRRWYLVSLVVISLAFSIFFLAGNNLAANLNPLEQLGKRLFFDKSLSSPAGQSCADCHAPEVGFTGPDQTANETSGVYQGAVHGNFGNRKPPAAAYAGNSPKLSKTEEGDFVGGMFWDGRATGAELGDPLAEQAQGPFLNPLEQNCADAKEVCEKFSKANADYKEIWEKAYPGIPFDVTTNVKRTYELIARGIAAYERSAEVNPFSSKYDFYLKDPGKYPLSEKELKGLKLFEGKAKCANCHTSKPGPKGEPPLFTDFTYDNLGFPKNPLNPFYYMPVKYNKDGIKWVDQGLGEYLAANPQFSSSAEDNYGKHKFPTLRNVAKRPSAHYVKCFGHNGYFKSLESIVQFYNTRDIPGMWPPPEVSKNINTKDVGNLGLSNAEVNEIVAFLKTLSDGYTPAAR